MCGRRGCLTAYAGARALLKRWKVPPKGRRAGGRNLGALREMMAAGLDGNAELNSIVMDGARALGLAIGNLENVYGPMVTVVHGLYTLFGEGVRALIEEGAQEQTQRGPAGSAVVRFSDLGEFAGSMGAALLARDRGFNAYVASKVLCAEG